MVCKSHRNALLEECTCVGIASSRAIRGYGYITGSGNDFRFYIQWVSYFTQSAIAMPSTYCINRKANQLSYIGTVVLVFIS